MPQMLGCSPYALTLQLWGKEAHWKGRREFRGLGRRAHVTGL